MLVPLSPDVLTAAGAVLSCVLAILGGKRHVLAAWRRLRRRVRTSLVFHLEVLPEPPRRAGRRAPR